MSKKKWEVPADKHPELNMRDIMQAMAALQTEHSFVVKVGWELASLVMGDSISIYVKAYTPGELDGPPAFERRMRWPCLNHKTVLGAVYWLLLTLDDDMVAQSFLDSENVIPALVA